MLPAGTNHLRRRGASRASKATPPMRFSPILPPRRPVFGRRQVPPDLPVVAGPTSEERRLIDRIIRRAGYRESR